MNEWISSVICRLLIVPVGRYPAEQVQTLCNRLKTIYKRVRCDVLAGLAIPEEYYNSQMKAYVADRVLIFLGETYPCKADEKILGITDVDLCLIDSSMPGYVFGLAGAAGKAALISSFRLHRDLPKQDDGSLLVERMTKEAMHELGHLSDLSHCHNTRCVMCFSKSTGGIDRKRVWYCLRCREHATFGAKDQSILRWIEPAL